MALGVSSWAHGTPICPSRMLSSGERAVYRYMISTLASSSLFLFLLPHGNCWRLWASPLTWPPARPPASPGTPSSQSGLALLLKVTLYDTSQRLEVPNSPPESHPNLPLAFKTLVLHRCLLLCSKASEPLPFLFPALHTHPRSCVPYRVLGSLPWFVDAF